MYFESANSVILVAIIDKSNQPLCIQNLHSICHCIRPYKYCHSKPNSTWQFGTAI